LELSPNNFIKSIYTIQPKVLILKKIQAADEPVRIRNAFEIFVNFALEAKIIKANPGRVGIR